ncbi:hypothetical protein Tco_0444747 [Tanacetum coccineum]
MLVFNEDYESSIRQISSHVYLRVLYLNGIESSTLPKSICKLIHLRYLKISNSEIEVLPESIIYLQNLQVLILEKCELLRELPKGLRYMRNLQRLDTSSFLLTHMPVEIKELTNLRRLSDFVVGKDDGAQIGLRDAKSANLKDNKSQVFKFYVVVEGWIRTNQRSQFDALKNCEQLPPLGKLPSLKRIELYAVGCLKCSHNDDNATSRDGDILFPNLQELNIYFYCEILSRRCEKGAGEDWHMISHIPHIDIRTPRSMLAMMASKMVSSNLCMICEDDQSQQTLKVLNRFTEPRVQRPVFPQLAADLNVLNNEFTRDEIQKGVCDCAGPKAQGPDAVKKFWDLLKNAFFVCAYIKPFKSTGRLAKGCNPSLISLVPEKKDPVEVIDYYNKKGVVAKLPAEKPPKEVTIEVQKVLS